MTRARKGELPADVELRRIHRLANRVNSKAAYTHQLTYKSLKANKDTRHLDQGYVPSDLPPGAAPPNTYTMLKDKGTYNGAELRPFDGRPGSMDAYKLPSRGIG